VGILMSLWRVIGVRVLGVICAMAAIGLGSAAPAHEWRAASDSAGSQTSSICAVPTVSGVAYQASRNGPWTSTAPNAAAAGTIVVTGANFVGACNRTVHIGGATFSNPILGIDMTGAQTLSVKPTAAKSLPSAASGAVSVTLSDWQGGANSSNTGTVRVYNLIQTPAAQTQDTSLLAGATEHVAGNAFTPFASQPSGGLAGALAMGVYPACAGAPQFFASVVGDGALTLGTPATPCSGPLNLTFIAPAYSDPAPASNRPDCGASPSTNCIKVTVTAGNVSVQPNGSGGSSGGTSGSGGSSSGSGNTSSGRGNTSPANGNTRSGSVPGPSRPGTTTPVVSPGAIANKQFVMSVVNVQSTPGSTVDFTVTFVVDGRPIVGAPVSVILLSAPRSDAAVTPKQGLTDAHGQLSGKLRLSRSPGVHLLLARSGIYSDEINVFGAIPTVETSGGNSPLGIDQLHINVSGNPLVIWLSVACVVLVLLGILVNLEVLGATFLRTTIIHPIARLRRRPPAGGALRR
jgi:uncharacterized membrane protein YgcG